MALASARAPCTHQPSRASSAPFKCSLGNMLQISRKKGGVMERPSRGLSGGLHNGQTALGTLRSMRDGQAMVHLEETRVSRQGTQRSHHIRATARRDVVRVLIPKGRPRALTTEPGARLCQGVLAMRRVKGAQRQREKEGTPQVGAPSWGCRDPQCPAPSCHPGYCLHARPQVPRTTSPPHRTNAFCFLPTWACTKIPLNSGL